MRYRFFEHTADAKFQAYGKSLEEAFMNAALAVASLMWDWQKIEPQVNRPIRSKGRDLKQLLVNFLEEVLFLFETKSFLLAGIENLQIRQDQSLYLLEGLFAGDEGVEKCEIFGEVKAITYNEMRIENRRGRYLIQAVVDR